MGLLSTDQVAALGSPAAGAATAAGAGGAGAAAPTTRAGAAHWSRRNQAPALFLSIIQNGIGKAAPDLLRITTSFTYKRHLGKASETKWVLRNDSRTLLDDPRTFPNTEWRFRFGYLNDLSAIKSGIIREVAPDYAMKRTVTITLYDASLGMVSSSSKNWGVVSSSTVAAALAKKHGLLAAIEDSKDIPKKAWIQPSDIRDIMFLRDLAALIDFEVFVDGVPPTLYYRQKRYERPPVARLTYYDDPTEFSYVKRFTPKVKSLGPVQTGVTGTDHEKGKGDKQSNLDPTKAGPAQAVYLTFGGSDRKAFYLEAPASAKVDLSHPVPSNVNTPALVLAARQQMLDKTNEATSEHPLTPSITAGDIFEWAGMEKQLNGKWYCVEENHSIHGTGSSTHVTWKRNTAGQGTTKAATLNNNSIAAQVAKVALVFAAKDGSAYVYVPKDGTPPTLVQTAPASNSQSDYTSQSIPKF